VLVVVAPCLVPVFSLCSSFMRKKSSRSLHEAKVVVVVLPKLQKAEFSLRKSIMLPKIIFLRIFVAFDFFSTFFVLEKDQTIRSESLD
jgi:uncharacterized membrane protein